MNTGKYSRFQYNGRELVLFNGKKFSVNELRSRLHQMEIPFNINETRKEILAPFYDSAVQSKENIVKIIDKIIFDTKHYEEKIKPQRQSCPNNTSLINIQKGKVPVLCTNYGVSDPILDSYNQNSSMNNQNVFLSDKVNIVPKNDYNTSYQHSMNNAQTININHHKQLPNNSNNTIFNEYIKSTNQPRQQSHSPIKELYIGPVYNTDATTNLKQNMPSDFDASKKAQITSSTNIAPFESNVSVIQPNQNHQEQLNLRNNLQPKNQENPFANNYSRRPVTDDNRRFNYQGYMPDNNNVLTDSLAQPVKPQSVTEDEGLLDTISKNRDTFIFGGLLSAVIIGVGYFVIFRNGRAILDFVRSGSASMIQYPRNAFGLLLELIKGLLKTIFVDKLFSATIPLVALGIVIYIVKKKYDEKQLINKIFNEFKEELKALNGNEISQEDFIRKYSALFQIDINKFRKSYFRRIEKLRRNCPNVKYFAKTNNEGKSENYYCYQD